jgi:hypothetical protein
MRRGLFKFVVILSLLASAFGQTIVKPGNGGLGTSAAPGVGQVPVGNVGGTYDPADPIVSFNYVNLLNAAVATATASSASPVRISTFGGSGVLYVTYASITGSPLTCTLQLKNADSLGNLINNGATIAVPPVNGTTTFAVTSAAALQTAAKMSVTYACGTYPTAGTITVDFVPGHSVSLLGPLGTFSNNGQASGANRSAVLLCIFQTDPQNGSAGTQGNDGAPGCGTDGNLWVGIQPALRPASYSTSKSFAGSSTTDAAVLPGNASNTVVVLRVIVSCIQTTAGNLVLNVIKRSTADTAGTSAAMTVVPDDSGFAAAISAPLSYTSTGPTVGTAVGNVDTYQLGCNAVGTVGPNDIYILDRRLKPIVLRGVAQQLAVNFGAAITGGNLTVTFEWEEIKTITP